MLVFGFAFRFVCSGSVLNGTLPSSDGGTVNWTQYASWACGTTAIGLLLLCCLLIVTEAKYGLDAL